MKVWIYLENGSWVCGGNKIYEIMDITEVDYFKAKLIVDETEKQLTINKLWLRCKSCTHIKRYKSGGRTYCEKQVNRSCLHGFKKIKPTDNICPMYEPIS